MILVHFRGSFFAPLGLVQFSLVFLCKTLSLLLAYGDGDSSDEVLGICCSELSFFPPVLWSCIATDLVQLHLPERRAPNLLTESSFLKLLCLQSSKWTNTWGREYTNPTIWSTSGVTIHITVVLQNLDSAVYIPHFPVQLPRCSCEHHFCGQIAVCFCSHFVYDLFQNNQDIAIRAHPWVTSFSVSSSCVGSWRGGLVCIMVRKH